MTDEKRDEVVLLDGLKVMRDAQGRTFLRGPGFSIWTGGALEEALVSHIRQREHEMLSGRVQKDPARPEGFDSLAHERLNGLYNRLNRHDERIEGLAKEVRGLNAAHTALEALVQVLERQVKALKRERPAREPTPSDPADFD